MKGAKRREGCTCFVVPHAMAVGRGGFVHHLHHFIGERTHHLGLQGGALCHSKQVVLLQRINRQIE